MEKNALFLWSSKYKRKEMKYKSLPIHGKIFMPILLMNSVYCKSLLSFYLHVNPDLMWNFPHSQLNNWALHPFIIWAKWYVNVITYPWALWWVPWCPLEPEWHTYGGRAPTDRTKYGTPWCLIPTETVQYWELRYPWSKRSIRLTHFKNM